VAAAALLRSFQNFSLGQGSRIDPDKLASATDQAAQLSAALAKLQAAVGEDDKAASAREVVPAGTGVDLVLQPCQAIVADWEATIESAREEAAFLKNRIPGWLTFAAIGATVLCAWMGLGQISLFAQAWKWFWSI